MSGELYRTAVRGNWWRGPLVGLAAVVVLLLLVGSSVAQERAVLRVMGSSLMVGAVDDLAKLYTKNNPNSVIICSGGGTERGIEGLLAKNVEIVLGTRDITSQEIQKAKAAGISPTKRVMAWGCVTIITNPANPVAELTMDEVRGIFTGEIKSWKALGGPDGDISVHITDPKKHGTNIFFKDKALGGAEFSPACKLEEDWAPLIRHVAADRNGVGFCLLNKSLDAGTKIKILPIKKAKDSPAVAPSWEAARDQSYPVARPLYFFWDANTDKAIVKDFIEFCAKQGVNPR